MSSTTVPDAPRIGVWLLVAALLGAGAARAEPARHEFSLGGSTLSYNSAFRRSFDFLAVDASYHHLVASSGPWRALRVGGGVRSGMPAEAAHFPAEVFLQAQLTARIGFWEPSAGPEVGLSGFARLSPRTFLPAREMYEEEDRRLSPPYLAFNASPLRFCFGALVVNVMELQVGTSVPLGNVTRLQLIPLRLGVRL